MRKIKDAADLFAAEGEGAKDVLEELKDGARDALELALSEAPEGSQRGRYKHVTAQIFPLLIGLEDDGERAAALGDVANRLKLGKRDLRTAFAGYEKRVRREQVDIEPDEGQPPEELAPEPGTERYERAMGLLKSPHFFGLFVRYTGVLGHVGDYVAKLLALLCALSAIMGRPIQPSTHAQSSAGKNALWDAVISFLPPEMVVRRTGLSAKALFRTAVDLSHKVLYIQEVVGSEDADYTIRTLQSDGRLVYEATEKTPDGSMRNVVHVVEGPTVVVQTTTRNHLHPENETRVFPFFVDESARQTRRIVDSYLREAEGGGTDPRERERILQGFRDAFRLLEPGEVVIPYASRIRIPDAPVRVRRDARRLLDLVRVTAWAHQHQRERDDKGRIVATEGDFRKALGLATGSLSSAWRSLAPVEEEVLKAVEKLPQSKKKNGFGRSDIEVEGRDNRRLQEALKSLSSTGYLDCDARPGPQGHRYTLARGSGEGTLGISLRPPGDVGEGANPGGHEADAGVDPAQNGEQDEEADGSRGIARIGERAIKGPSSPEEGAIARSRGIDEAGHFEDDDHEEGGKADHLGGLTELGWYRAQTVFPVEGGPEDGLLDTDLVARKLRHEVGIYKGRDWWSDVYGNPTPWAATAEDLLAAWPGGGTEADGAAAPWPRTPGEMSARLKQIVPLLQAEARPFWDPGFSDWYAGMAIHHPSDTEEVCREAHLHAELWRNEGTGEEIWALVALREGWRVPDREIEEVVWSRAARVPTDEVAPETDDAFEF